MIFKIYFLLVNLFGYFIIFVSSYNFYSQDLKDPRWIISTLLGIFIVIFKNSKINELNYKKIYYFVDTTFALSVILIMRFANGGAAFIGRASVLVLILVYLMYYYRLITKGHVTFIGQV